MSNIFNRALQALENLKNRMGKSSARRNRAQRARESLNNSDFNRIQKDLDRYRKTGYMTPRLKRYLRALSETRDREYLNEVERRGGSGAAQTTPETEAALDKMLDALGPLGKVIRSVWRNNGAQSSGDQLRAAAEVMKAYGNSESDVSNPAGINQAIDALDQSGLGFESREDAGQLLEDMRAIEARGGVVVDPWNNETPKSQRATTMGETGLSEITHTSNSSNVFSFQYDYTNSTMYVRFKAPELSASVKNHRGAGGMLGIRGKAGKTIVGRTNKPGALYAYYDVPVRVYKRLVAASSAGKAVWDELRIRGTVWGHQYRYSLVQGAIVPGESGALATYVPRRATKNGYKQRSVTEVGTGRRNYVGSSINTSPNRGRPNRGQG